MRFASALFRFIWPSAKYGHDTAGFPNLKGEATSSGQRETSYYYEPSGLLFGVDLPDGRRIEYAYDANGQRTEKRVDGRLVEAYRWLDPLRLEEFLDAERWWRLAYDPERPSRPPVGVTKGECSFLIVADQLDTPLALADCDGNVVPAMRRLWESAGSARLCDAPAARLRGGTF